MAEVRQVPGKGFVVPTNDGEVKQIPGLVFYVEEATAPPSGLSIPIAAHHYRQMQGVN